MIMIKFKTLANAMPHTLENLKYSFTNAMTCLSLATPAAYFQSQSILDLFKACTELTVGLGVFDNVPAKYALLTMGRQPLLPKTSTGKELSDILFIIMDAVSSKAKVEDLPTERVVQLAKPKISITCSGIIHGPVHATSKDYKAALCQIIDLKHSGHIIFERGLKLFLNYERNELLCYSLKQGRSFTWAQKFYDAFLVDRARCPDLQSCLQLPKVAGEDARYVYGSDISNNIKQQAPSIIFQHVILDWVCTHAMPISAGENECFDFTLDTFDQAFEIIRYITVSKTLPKKIGVITGVFHFDVLATFLSTPNTLVSAFITLLDRAGIKHAPLAEMKTLKDVVTWMDTDENKHLFSKCLNPKC